MWWKPGNRLRVEEPCRQISTLLNKPTCAGLGGSAGKLGIGDEHLEPFGYYKARYRWNMWIASRTAGRQADPCDGDQPDSGGRRQDDHNSWPRRRAEPDRQERVHLSPRALTRTGFWHEGRCGRRRLCAGCADGGYQPPFYGRLSVRSVLPTIFSPR